MINGKAPFFKNDLEVLNYALTLEHLESAAYVEAEHASALADLASPGSDLFAPEAFATPRTPDQVMQIVAPFFAAAAPAPAPAPTPAPSAPSAPPKTGGGGDAHYARRLGDE
jgi:hypothetical protein